MSLTLDEARARAAQLSVTGYTVDLDVTDRHSLGSVTRVEFTCAAPGGETFLELADATDLAVEGAAWEYADGRIRLRSLAEENVVTVSARLPYVTDGDGMHTFTDPADGATYVSAYTSMDNAQRVFACFDQPDLKAPVTLRVTAPTGWTVLANGMLASVAAGADHTLWTFAPTPPIPPYLFTVCCGPWVTREWEHASLRFAWHARASQEAALERDLEDLRDLTERCFDRYVEIFDEPYPFDTYDQVFAPGLNWGAMEFPGCVVFRDELLPPETPREPERRWRAMVVAHEMAHMWFGDLATMRWWEDAWLNESFADYMGYRMADEAAGVAGLAVDFTVDALPASYAADSRRSTHPVAVPPEDVPDVDTSRGNFDDLTYAKGGALLRQLVVWLGDEAFLAGSNAYLSRYAWGNASLAEFVECLDAATDRDVRGWVDTWLTTTGFDTLAVSREGDDVVVTREGSRPHRCTVATYDASWRLLDSVLVDVADSPVPVAGGAYVVPNAGGETFAALRLDPATAGALGDGLVRIEDPQTRAVLWVHMCEQVRLGLLPTTAALRLIRTALPSETSTPIVHAMLGWVGGAPLTWWTPAGAVAEAEQSLALAGLAGLAATKDPQVGAAWARGVVRGTDDAVLLERWLADGRADGPAGLIPVDTGLRWSVLTRLARLGAIDPERIEAERVADGTRDGVVGAARALAAIPTEAAKAAAWAVVVDPATSNRELEATLAGLWDPRQPALLAPYVARYVAEIPALAAERTPITGQLLGQGFPLLPLTVEQVTAFETALDAGYGADSGSGAGSGSGYDSDSGPGSGADSGPGSGSSPAAVPTGSGAGSASVPTVLRREWEDRLDDLRFPG